MLAGRGRKGIYPHVRPGGRRFDGSRLEQEMTGTLDTTPLDAALAAAIRRYVEAQRRSVATAPRRLERIMLLRRLGLDDAALGQALAAKDARRLPEPLRALIGERIAVELRRLSRQARGGDSRYDINRHIAARRLSNWLEGARDPDEEAADHRTGGRVLNARFARRRKGAAAGRRRSG
jgi:hypothetical protein